MHVLSCYNVHTNDKEVATGTGTNLHPGKTILFQYFQVDDIFKLITYYLD